MRALTAAAVWDEKTNEFVAIIDIFEIMVTIAWGCFRQVDAERAPLNFSELKAESVIGITAEGQRVWSYEANTPLESLLDAFSKGVHRVIVAPVDQRANPNNSWILSQTDVLKFLYQNGKKDMGQLSRSVSELNLVSRNVKVCTVNETVLEASRAIYQANIMAVAIVDENRKLVGTFSSSDLRGTTAQNVKEVETKKLNEYTNKMIYCAENDSLFDVIAIALKGLVHRVWIVDEQRVPIGVVTLSDIIRNFSPYNWK
jgi:CBS domain-containing protein